MFKKKKKKAVPDHYPDTTALIWNKGLAKLCDYYDFSTPPCPGSYQNIKHGAAVWVRTQNLPFFLNTVFPSIKHTFTLVTGDSIQAVPYELSREMVNSLTADNRLIKWYAQNCLCERHQPHAHKLKPLPLGIDFHSQYEKESWRFKKKLTPAGQEQELLHLRQANLPLSQRRVKVYADFHLNNSSRKLKKRIPWLVKRNRRQLYKSLRAHPAFVFQKKRMLRKELWRQMSRYRFVISPPGSGLDCHRTWEALALGCYVIVEKSPLDILYKDLPVIIVEDFSAISAAKLHQWAAMLDKRFSSESIPVPLTNNY
ncbi:MAG TPA: hypothetical protein VKS21_04060, partial [Spirochaetota bacterium]|nr:hypothetical protein [Spirochaetota bacterium]